MTLKFCLFIAWLILHVAYITVLFTIEAARSSLHPFLSDVSVDNSRKRISVSLPRKTRAPILMKSILCSKHKTIIVIYCL